MMEIDRKRNETRARILKAMAHPTRLFILEKLNVRPHCVCELTALIGADVSTVSKHLSVLRNAGIISDRKQGTMVFYSLEAPCLLPLLSCAEQVVEEYINRQLTSLDRG